MNPKAIPSAETGPIACRVCNSLDLEGLIDFGGQPVCNHYLTAQDAGEKHFPRSLSQCSQCGLIQMPLAVPASELRPVFDWIRYDEAEGHLDDLVGRIIQTTNLEAAHTIYGLSYKDATTLNRFKDKGFQNTVLVNVAEDLGEPSPCAGVETIQAIFDEERALSLREKHGAAHVILVRHVLEHVHNMQRFVRAIRTLLAPGGYLVVEVPDFSIPLEYTDYCTIWEEHTVFFTPTTLHTGLSHLGFNVVETVSYPYPLENALIAIAQPSDRNPAEQNLNSIQLELLKGRTYATAFPGMRKAIFDYLSTYATRNQPVAMFGAGHLACDFINLLGLKDLFAFVVDDHPKKCGLFMPGSRLPILGSSALVDKKAGLCLLSLKPESEPVVIEKNRAFTRNGGSFASIFPTGPHSLRNQLELES